MNRPLTILLSLIPGLGIPAAFTAAYSSTLNFNPVWTWLITINLMLLALMGKDKLTAKSTSRSKKSPPFLGRTPEFTLLTLTTLGATPAMLVSRRLFNHKTSKQNFIYTLFVIIALQVVLSFIFWHNLKTYL